MKYRFITDHKGRYSVATLCRTLGVSRRGYYTWRGRPASARTRENQRLVTEITHIFTANRHVYGAPRIHSALVAGGLTCSVNRVARLMRRAGLVPKTVRKFRITTDSRQSRHPADNLLEQDFTAHHQNQKWVSDVTYIPTREGWLFLAIVLDLYSRKVVGWSMGDKLTSDLAQQALRHAIGQRQGVTALMIHSDRGKEYYAADYQALLARYGMTCSMSRKGNCYDNAAMESFFHSLKVEQVHHDDYRTRAQARSSMFDYIELFYNRQRRHSYLGYRSPVDFENACVA